MIETLNLNVLKGIVPPDLEKLFDDLEYDMGIVLAESEGFKSFILLGYFFIFKLSFKYHEANPVYNFQNPLQIFPFFLIGPSHVLRIFFT